MKTPVEWLEEQINLHLKDPLSPKFQELFETAKKFERIHLKQCYVDGANNVEDTTISEIKAKVYINSKYQSK